MRYVHILTVEGVNIKKCVEVYSSCEKVTTRFKEIVVNLCTKHKGKLFNINELEEYQDQILNTKDFPNDIEIINKSVENMISTYRRFFSVLASVYFYGDIWEFVHIARKEVK